MRKIFFPLVCSLAFASLPAYDDLGSFFIGGDWLYWKVEEQNLSVGAHVIQSTNTDPSKKLNLVDSIVLNPDFKTNNGFRVAAGYVTQDLLWEITAAYTHVPTNANVDLALSPEQLATNKISLFSDNFPLLTPFPDTNWFAMHWKSDIDYLDLDLARTFTFCDVFDITPHIGIRGSWLCQSSVIQGFEPDVFLTKTKTRTCGIGMEGGIFGSWNLPYGVSIIGHVGGSLTYNKVRNKNYFIGNETEISYKNPKNMSLAWFDTFFGFSYTKGFCSVLVNIHAGWEHHTVFNANQFSVNGGGDMTMQGLTLGAFIQF